MRQRALTVLVPLAAVAALPATAAATMTPLPSAPPKVGTHLAFTAASKLPVVTGISPKKVEIGQTLTITGKNFVPGTGKNSVIFKASKGRAIFVKAGVATKTSIKVKIPEKLGDSLAKDKDGNVVLTTFQIRVLAKRLGASFTKTSASPQVGPKGSVPAKGGAGSTPAPAPADSAAPATLGPAPVDPRGPEGDFDGDGISNATDTDDDNDLIPDSTEAQIHTDPFNPDTDGDGVSDGYEYRSAIDLNSQALPYPGKRPYANALDATDANTDFDGDGMTMAEEYAAWVKFGTHTYPITLNYSDGKQISQSTAVPSSLQDPYFAFLDTNHDGTVSAAEGLGLDFDGSGTVSAGEMSYMDYNGDGVLGDEEKDVDGDGLTNFDEAHGRLNPLYWPGIYTVEKPYPIAYAQPAFLDADTDGDGLVDGLDDQDLDGYTNLKEMSRLATGATPSNPQPAHGRVNPFNPCLPDSPANGFPSPTCMLHPPADPAQAPAPYDGSPSNPYAVLQ